MILFLDGTSRGVQCNHVGYSITDYESAFELLTQLVADGWILQAAVIIDETGRMNVPMEAFDGQPIQEHIRTLQRQWQLILSPLPDPANSLTTQRIENWHVQMEVYYDSMISYLEKMISLIGIQQTRIATYPNESIRIHLQNQYDRLLSNNRLMHKQAKKSRQRNDTRLNKLKKNL